MSFLDQVRTLRDELVEAGHEVGELEISPPLTEAEYANRIASHR